MPKATRQLHLQSPQTQTSEISFSNFELMTSGVLLQKQKTDWHSQRHKHVNPRCQAKVPRCGLRPGCGPYIVVETPNLPSSTPNHTKLLQWLGSGQCQSSTLSPMLLGRPALTLSMMGYPQGCRVMTQKKPGSLSDWQGAEWFHQPGLFA